MTDQQIKKQVEAIKSVTKSITSSREKAEAFQKAAGISSTPPAATNRQPQGGPQKR